MTTKLKFKTNIQCGGCIAKVTPFLNQTEGVSHWEVDTDHKDKILTVTADENTEEKVIESVKKAGFQIESIS